MATTKHEEEDKNSGPTYPWKGNIALTNEAGDEVERIAADEDRPVSSVLRRLVTAGLAARANK